MIAQEKALKTYGIDRQRIKLAEECSELAAAAIRLSQAEGQHLMDNFLEEIADVEIMLEQMRLHYGDSPIDGWRSRKLARLEKRLGIKGIEFSSHIPAPKKQKEPDTERKIGSRAKLAIWVDGEFFKNVNQAKNRFGSGLPRACAMGNKSYKGHRLDYTDPTVRAEA